MRLDVCVKVFALLLVLATLGWRFVRWFGSGDIVGEEEDILDASGRGWMGTSRKYRFYSRMSKLYLLGLALVGLKLRNYLKSGAPLGKAAKDQLAGYGCLDAVMAHNMRDCLSGHELLRVEADVRGPRTLALPGAQHQYLQSRPFVRHFVHVYGGFLQ